MTALPVPEDSVYRTMYLETHVQYIHTTETVEALQAEVKCALHTVHT